MERKLGQILVDKLNLIYGKNVIFVMSTAVQIGDVYHIMIWVDMSIKLLLQQNANLHFNQFLVNRNTIICNRIRIKNGISIDNDPSHSRNRSVNKKCGNFCRY